jgi:Mor family transcriptional regulator
MAGKPKVPYETLVEAFLKVKSATQVAAQHGVTEQTVFAALNRHGLKAWDFRYRNPSDQEILTAYEQLGSGTEVAKLLQTDSHRVYDVLKKNGVDTVFHRKQRIRVISVEQEPEIMREYESGKSMAVIASEYGCSANAILELLKRNGAKTRKRKLDLPKDEIKALYESGFSYTQIAAKYGCGYTPIITLINREFPEIVRPKTGPQGPRWRGGRFINRWGYVEVWIDKDDPMACMGHKVGKKKGTTYVEEHRLVMARHLGRPLRPDETVHHVRTKEKTNNALDNLQLRQGNHGKHGPMICLDCGSSNLGYVPIADQPEELKAG